MNKILDYTIPFFIKGFLLDENYKYINKIILDTGYTLELSSNIAFHIGLKSKNQQYKINNLLDKIFIEKANEKMISNSLLSKKDILISKFNYSSSIYNASKYCIFKLLQKSQFRVLRDFIKEVVYSIEINSFIKKLSLIPIIEILFNILITYDDKIPPIYPNISIDNIGNFEKCNGKYISISDNDSWTSQISNIDNIEDYLKLSINLIFGTITSSKIPKIKTMLNIEFEGNDLTSLIGGILNTISDNDKKFLESFSITNYNNLLKLIPASSCKLSVYIIDNNKKINKIKIIDELIQNNYSKIQILDNFKILSNTERYRYNTHMEIFLSNKDLNSKNRIAELYKSIKKL